MLKNYKDGLINNLIEKLNEEALPLAGEAFGTTIGTATGNPALGAVVGNELGQMGRERLKAETGFGIKGIGKFKVDETLLSKYTKMPKCQMNVSPKKLGKANLK